MALRAAMATILEDQATQEEGNDFEDLLGNVTNTRYSRAFYTLHFEMPDPVGHFFCVYSFIIYYSFFAFFTRGLGVNQTECS